MKTIKINCDCGLTHEVRRDKISPESAISMGCNWCPDCEDIADDYYNEWYNFNEDTGTDDTGTDDPMQLMLFSIADEILNEKVLEV